MLKASDTWSEQLFECAATVAAIEDVMYYLDKALQNEVIDLKTYLKQIRSLATEQFLAKALAMKIENLQKESASALKHGGGGRDSKGSSFGLPRGSNAPPSYDSVWETGKK
jgi:capsule polysaccharide export protein KpsE/RkpR